MIDIDFWNKMIKVWTLLCSHELVETYVNEASSDLGKKVAPALVKTTKREFDHTLSPVLDLFRFRIIAVTVTVQR